MPVTIHRMDKDAVVESELDPRVHLITLGGHVLKRRLQSSVPAVTASFLKAGWGKNTLRFYLYEQKESCR